jgi:hypothetical protein
MKNVFGSNLDDVRLEIMRLENEPVFDQRAWAQVLAQLSNSPSRRQDAVRRMMTANQNATTILEQPQWFVGVDVASAQDRTVRQVVAVETVEA